MKQIYLIFLLFLALPLMSKAAGTATVTFDATTDRSTTGTISKGGITITSIMGNGNIGTDFNHTYSKNGIRYPDYMCSSGATVYFTSTVGNITTIVIAYRSEPNAIQSVSTGKFTGKTTWKGYDSSMNFSCSGAAYITSITVTYAIPDGTISISSAKYATFWNASRYTMPNGVTGYTISSVENDITYGTTYSAGKVVPANTPLLLHGNEGTYHYYNTSSTATAAGTNLLQCSTGVEISNANTYYYKLSYRSSTDRTLGFYWDSDDGHSINISNGKAFLAVPEAIAGNAKGFDITNITNGINQLTTNKNIMPAIGEIVYDASGKAHPYSTSLPRGIYFIKGVGKIAIK